MTGTVQGVGFRPFLHRLARRLSLTGVAGNDTSGVWCEIQGAEANLDEFQRHVLRAAPPLARVDSVTSTRIAALVNERTFEIKPSRSDPALTSAVTPPDAAICSPCQREISDPARRRFGYAFTCCTDCGPRFTVVEALPYDRERTSMAEFELCEACDREYRDPSDRRHHAQALCCPDCGPELWVKPNVSVCSSQPRVHGDGDEIAQAAELLRSGNIVAIKGVGGYQLACRADDASVVQRLRIGKDRPHKPFALLVAALEAAREVVQLNDLAAEHLAGFETPIMLAQRHADSSVAPNVAPDTALLGVMLPASPLHSLLAKAAGVPLVCTSGNRRGEPITTANDAAIVQLGDVSDAVLGHNRRIVRRADDSVGRVVAGDFQLLRRARGFAPTPVPLAGDGAVVLGVGAELKNTVCVSLGSQAHISVHIGDLTNPQILDAFEVAVAELLELSGDQPQLVAHDLHPEYLSTKFATSCDLAPTLGVQHHHAHLASCVADAGYGGRVIGAIFDGIGWGTDGTVWGGEFLVGSASGYERAAHLRPVPMPGGAAAVRQPWRMALAHLDSASLANTGVMARLTKRGDHADQVDPVLELCRSDRTLRTSSMGRLFDAVAALCGLGDDITYEGQAAIRLEDAAGPDVRNYPVELSGSKPVVIETAPLFEAVVSDLASGESVAHVSGAFHRWVCDLMIKVSRRLRDLTGLEAVALSGGVFQNARLMELTVGDLQAAGFKVIRHRHVPPNDGGISLGQVAVGRAHLRADS